MERPLRIRRERRCERKARGVIGAKESKTEKEPAGGQVVSARADPQPAPGARQGCYSRLLTLLLLLLQVALEGTHAPPHSEGVKPPRAPPKTAPPPAPPCSLRRGRGWVP